jgi:parallel beta-helix repeat protein
MAPGLGGFSIVRITMAQNVSIVGFTITGPGPGPCGTLHYGVRVEGGGSANILGNHITHIRDEPLSGCQNGVAIGVGRAAEGTTGSATIVGNLIDDYQKNGPTVSNVGSSAVIAHNRVLGIGPTDLIAQNGIQVSGGATASVRNNFVAQNIYTPQTVSSTGILLFASGNVVTEHNTVTSNDVGIYVFAAVTGSTIRDNRVRGSTFDGVILQGSFDHQVAHNAIDHNAGPGIGLYDDAQNNTLDNNKIENNDDSGVLLDIASNNVVSKNKVNDNGTDGADMTDGIRINAHSTGNTIRDNHLKHNVTHDCHDGSTGNTWTKNKAQTSFPTRLCGKEQKGGNDDDLSSESSTAFGWDASLPWYRGFGEVADPGTAAAVDTESLLRLPAATRTATRRAGTASPDQ